MVSADHIPPSGICHSTPQSTLLHTTRSTIPQSGPRFQPFWPSTRPISPPQRPQVTPNRREPGTAEGGGPRDCLVSHCRDGTGGIPVHGQQDQGVCDGSTCLRARMRAKPTQTAKQARESAEGYHRSGRREIVDSTAQKYTLRPLRGLEREIRPSDGNVTYASAFHRAFVNRCETPVCVQNCGGSFKLLWRLSHAGGTSGPVSQVRAPRGLLGAFSTMLRGKDANNCGGWM